MEHHDHDNMAAGHAGHDHNAMMAGTKQHDHNHGESGDEGGMECSMQMIVSFNKFKC